ncbi:phenylacetate-CoA oxygenase subunit PaaI [Mycobacterium kyorinense]|uniref:Phenylacetate-CoA oxygenase subunit PaaI n=1 Tax=Mycobacterium kyorinense TaxID=487514 RepID=A0A1A2ZHQ8_9MYCO|nr:1,2-phenylacetyl-CoA epoxidase subunit PaaC [Mycobacterium kyorinense]OBI49775.1 phenylacetate-CoA oxygenase subunit PaaI [Mycobacterium kyorinense]
MIDHDSAYTGLVDIDAADQWAFGTSFDDPLAGVDTRLADGIDGADLASYCLMLGDDALIVAQRLTQWLTRAPELEEEVALANIGLDLLGQARLLLARAAAADPDVVPTLPEGSPIPAEDALAFFRGEPQFVNVRLAELDNGDFAVTITRLLVFATYRLALLQRLRGSRDPVLAAVAAKGVKEVTYQRDYAARWLITLACGTAESRRRVEAALGVVWPYVGELFIGHPVETRLAAVGAGVDPADLRAEFDAVMRQVFHAAELLVPPSTSGGRSGRDGMHTGAMGPLLTEMQSVAREHPLGQW